jgi:hypothetical protein
MRMLILLRVNDETHERNWVNYAHFDFGCRCQVLVRCPDSKKWDLEVRKQSLNHPFTVSTKSNYPILLPSSLSPT